LHANDVGFGYVGLLPFASFDLPYTVQDFLPPITLGLEVDECHTVSFLPITDCSNRAFTAAQEAHFPQRDDLCGVEKELNFH
jgi:hypothetical protein